MYEDEACLDSYVRMSISSSNVFHSILTEPLSFPSSSALCALVVRNVQSSTYTRGGNESEGQVAAWALNRGLVKNSGKPCSPATKLPDLSPIRAPRPAEGM